MPRASQLDGKELERLYLPYDTISAELSPEPRIVDGLNSYVTLGGKIRKRPGTSVITNSATPAGYDNGIGGGTVYGVTPMWEYWTLEDTGSSPVGIPQSFWLASFRKVSNQLWEMFWWRHGISTSWTSLGSYRDLNASLRPHETIVVKGKAYIRGFPTTGDKYCSVIFDGVNSSAVTLRPWGIPGPSTPARISGQITKLSGAISSGAASLVVSANFGSMPSTPFTIQIDYERMSVTVVAGTTWTVTRATDGTVAAAHADKSPVLYRDWSASDNAVDVAEGWQYTYAYKSITGQISNVSGLETNPDNMPSSSAPFRDLKPKVTLVGQADTTNIPTVVVYRTADGGGTFYKLEEVANPGAGNFTYTDDSLGSGGSGTTFNNPLPDELLDTGDIAPGTATNTPPVPVLAPKVIGTDAVEHHTPFAYYAGRIWFGMKNVLIYSANEELDSGIPEESFNTSNGRGNFITFPHKIANVISTINALYVLTDRSIYIVTGQTKETFNPRVLYQNIGAKLGLPRGAIAIKNRVVFVTSTNQIAITNDSEEPDYISRPIATVMNELLLSIKDFIQLHYYQDGDKDWLIVHNALHPRLGGPRQLVLDFALTDLTRQPFWQTMWTIPCCSFLVSNNYLDRNSFIGFQWNGSDGQLTYFPFVLTSGQVTPLYSDAIIGVSQPEIDFHFTTNLFRPPAGNQLNDVSIGTRNPVQQYLKIHHTSPENETIEQPQIFFYFDDFWTDPVPAEEDEKQQRRQDSKGYSTTNWQINRTADRISFKYSVPGSSRLVEVQDWAFVLNPNGGA